MNDVFTSTLDEALSATVALGPGEPTPGFGRAAVDLARGTLIGRYVVLSRQGAGGMGVVFAAYDPELDRKVALKLLHPRFAADPTTTREARSRLVREAQALARLSHPHIVAVHDVGEHEGAVWMAMEYIDGETLSEWLKRRRTWREVLAVLTPAARGLSAAHEAGLVHRDIKPDNIMVGRDGRVRVMDLGLAGVLGGDEGPTERLPLAATTAVGDLATLAVRVTQAGAMLGTPAYMSPEQFRGEPADARADVFSFCVTLWEALMGERPFAGDTLVELAANVLAGGIRPVPRDPHARRVPGWLRRVCQRGLAALPERRFASMAAVLDTLSHGQVRARMRNWLVGAAAAALGGSAFVYQNQERIGRIAACEEVGARIFDVWSEEARAGVRAGILATGLGYAPMTADKVMPFLDAQAEAWREQRTRACLQADVEGTLDVELSDRALWCLDERRMELVALLAELSRADETTVLNAVSAAASLRPVSPCTDGQVLAALPSPPPAAARLRADAVRTALSQAHTLSLSGKYAEGLERTRTALADSEALGWPPMTAAARQAEGHLLAQTGAYAEAESASLLAYMEAAKVRSWDVAASAASVLVNTVGHHQARHLEGKVWAGHAEVAVLFAGDPLGLREAFRLNDLASVHATAGEYAEAKALLGRALAILERALSPDHPDIAGILNSLAVVHLSTGAFADAKALQERALAVQEKVLGPDHPEVAVSLNNLASVHAEMGGYAEARALYERALAIKEKALGPDHPDVATSLDNLASVHHDIGGYAEARALYERALAIREEALGPDHPAVATTLNNLAVAHRAVGRHAEAKALYERELALWEKALGPDHPNVARSLVSLALVHQLMGGFAEAKALNERALAIREKALGPEHPSVAASLGRLGALALERDQPVEALSLLERAVAVYDAHEGVQAHELEDRFHLARALVRVGTDRARALTEARKAADGLRAAGGGKGRELAKVEAFLAQHAYTP